MQWITEIKAKPGQGIKLKHFIDPAKGLTPLICIFLITYYGQWENPTATTYLALHGTYGILWMTKSAIFGDPRWEQPVPLWFGACVFIFLASYFYGPYLICSSGIQRHPLWLCICTSLFAFGVFIHFASDMQKSTQLKLKKGLITDGLFAFSRNPNYFGELLIYFGFTAIALHPIPLIILFSSVALYWLPSMRRKDRSISRHPEFAEYAANTAFFIPYVW